MRCETGRSRSAAADIPTVWTECKSLGSRVEFTSDPKFGSTTFSGDVSDPAFSPDGKLLAAGKYGGGTVSLVGAAHLRGKFSLRSRCRCSPAARSRSVRTASTFSRHRTKAKLDRNASTEADEAAFFALRTNPYDALPSDGRGSALTFH